MRHLGEERGVVMIEFLMAIVPVMLMFLGAVQLLLLAADRVVVAHAAGAAARSAAVVLDDDPAAYDGEPVGHLDRPADSAKPPAPGPARPAAGMTAALSILEGAKTRLDVIRRAANAPLAAMGPSPGEVARWFLSSREGAVADAIDGSPLVRTLANVSFYNRAALALRIDPDAHDGLVTARVTYLAHCAVPVVSLLICRRLSAILESDADARRALDDVPAPDVRRALGATDERFVVLSATAGFPRQRARYFGAKSG
jgi:hypothetical protein